MLLSCSETISARDRRHVGFQVRSESKRMIAVLKFKLSELCNSNEQSGIFVELKQRL